MQAICEDGTTVTCKQCKAIEAGVLLFADREREELVGFIPHRQLRYLLPDDVGPGSADRAAGAESARRASGPAPDDSAGQYGGQQPGGAPPGGPAPYGPRE